MLYFTKKLFVIIGLFSLMLMLVAGCSQERSVNLFDEVAIEDSANQGEEVGPPVSGRLHWDTRTAIKLEAFYALNPAHNGGSSKSIGGWLVSDWRYLTSDMNAYNVAKGWYGGNSSVWSMFWSNPVRYALYGGYGRAGQCRYFVNLIMFRSGTYQSPLPTYNNVVYDFNHGRSYTKMAEQVRKGDILQRRSPDHTAIVVAIIRGQEGQSVRAVDVVDANYVGGRGNEIIGRHILDVNYSGVADLDDYIAIDVVALGAR